MLQVPSHDGGLRLSVELHGIERRFDGQTALRGIDLEVRQGEFLALIGPSGAGKSTLLRVIAGLEPGHGGTVRINGQPVGHLPARARNIGFVFQNYALFRHMTVAENVAFGLRILPRARRPSRAAIAARVADLLTLVQVPELGSRTPAQISGGQRQRVALARALATEPSLLLLDEPFGALDPMVRKDIRAWLRDLHDRLGLTSIFVTHDQSEAVELADRLALLRDGRLEQVGTAEALERHPATPFVTRFLGDSIAVSGTVMGGRMIPDHPAVLEFAANRPDGRVMALIRPYELKLQPGHGARVLAVRRAGPHRRVTVAWASREAEILLPWDLPAVSLGDDVQLDISEARLFSAEQDLPPAAPGLATAALQQSPTA
jgi:sulfate transport system ATP-binding protein